MSATFHILQASTEAAFLKAACLLTEKIYSSIDFHSTVQTLDPVISLCCCEEHITKLDDLLWSASPESFMPHVIDNTNAPIVLSTDFLQTPILINLSLNMPKLIYDHIYEIVGLSERHTSQCRERYQSYKNLKMAVTYDKHEISTLLLDLAKHKAYIG